MKLSDLTIPLYESFNPNAVYLHGGPANLDGNAFRRYMRNGSDSGGLFFIEESKVGYKYAAGYAATKNGAIWRVKLNLNKSQVFDFSNRQHRTLAKRNLSPQEFEYWVESSTNNHIDWAVVDEEILEEWGFKAALLFERAKGFDDFEHDAISVVVFDPSVVQIIDSISIQQYNSSIRESQTLTELKSAPLFHFTDVDNIDNILNGNTLNASDIDDDDHDAISLTRNKNIIGFSSPPCAVLVFDQQAIVNKMKMVPYRGDRNKHYQDFPDYNTREQEERLYSDLNNLHNYLKMIFIMLDDDFIEDGIMDLRVLLKPILDRYSRKYKIPYKFVDYKVWRQTPINQLLAGHGR